MVGTVLTKLEVIVQVLIAPQVDFRQHKMNAPEPPLSRLWRKGREHLILVLVKANTLNMGCTSLCQQACFMGG